MADEWYTANRRGLEFDGVCVGDAPVGGSFLVSATIDRSGPHADVLLRARGTGSRFSEELRPLIEVLARRGFSAQVNSVPCAVTSVAAD